jgi:hypothetical protein
MWEVRGSVGASAGMISTARVRDGWGWDMTEVSALCGVLEPTTRTAGERIEAVMERKWKGSENDGS